jgi:ATP-dependent Clp protease ATP-binding subunit ClpA
VFERFTDAARETVVRAQTEARELGHGFIGAEHLLLAALRRPNEPGAGTLLALGVTADAVRAQIEVVVGRGTGGLTASDADALGTLGIDLDQVRRHVEDSFGHGALDEQPVRRRRGLFRRRGPRCDEQGRLTGHIPFSPRAKRALEHALREALALGDRHIGVEHITLGLLDTRGNAAVEVLGRLGVEPATARQQILGDLGKAA